MFRYFFAAVWRLHSIDWKARQAKLAIGDFAILAAGERGMVLGLQGETDLVVDLTHPHHRRGGSCVVHALVCERLSMTQLMADFEEFWWSRPVLKDSLIKVCTSTFFSHTPVSK